MYISKKTRLRVYQKYDGHCAYCGKEITLKQMQVDHLVPHQGLTMYPELSEFENLMPSCRKCNHYKRAFTLNMYRGLIMDLIPKLQKDYLLNVAIDYGIADGNFKEWDGLFYFEKINK